MTPTSYTTEPNVHPSWLPERVELVEVGLRDGLQNLPTVLPTRHKLALLDGLIEAGLKNIQVASFVHPARVPQMADAEALCTALPHRPGVRFSGLALNQRGVERAAAAGLKHIDLSLSASEPHSRRNVGMGVDEAETQLLGTITEAHQLGLRVRGGVQCAFGCSEGDAVAPETVVRLAASLVAAGVEELALADSAGTADPLHLQCLVEQVQGVSGELPLVLHLHDTRGLGLANLWAALQLGVTRFDTAFGGLGGCPFIPGAMGNVATEDATHLLHVIGVATGINEEALCRVSGQAQALLDAKIPSRMYQLWRQSVGAVEESQHAADSR